MSKNKKNSSPELSSPPLRRSVKGRIQARYDTHMPDKGHHRALVWAAFLSCAVVIAFQLLYPPDRALPLTRIAGENVGGQEYNQLAETIITSFRNTKLQLVVE